tara:strand:- start:1637 stop:1786 length:150 start_codon:yes stop_codon:yes gene_type:complete
MLLPDTKRRTRPAFPYLNPHPIVILLSLITPLCILASGGIMLRIMHVFI